MDAEKHSTMSGVPESLTSMNLPKKSIDIPVTGGWQTKWDYLSERDREFAERQWLVRACSYCGIILMTEADFAKHFVLPDARYLNLGYCPVRMVRKLQETISNG